MDSVSSITKIGSYKTLEQAIEATRKNKGNEVVAKDEDGGYAVFSCDKNSVIDNSFKDGNSTFKVVGLSFESDNNSFQRQELPEDNVIEEGYHEINDIPGIGSKVSDTFIDNQKHNRFNTSEEAVRASLKHEGMEAVVKNPDGTFSLYRINNEQIEALMKNPNSDPRIQKIVAPYSIQGKNFGQDRVFELTPQGKKSYLSDIEKLNNNPKEFISSLMKKGKSGMSLDDLSRSNIKNVSSDLAQATANLKDLKNFSDSLKIIAGSNDDITVADVKYLETNYHNIMSQINSGSIKVSAEEKANLEKLAPQIEELKNKAVELENSQQDYNKSIDDIGGYLNDITSALSKLEKQGLDKGDDNAVNTLKAMIGDATVALKSGNMRNAEAAKVYLAKLNSYLQSGKVSVMGLKNIWNDFNNMSAMLNNFNHTGKISESDKKLFFDSLKGLGGDAKTKAYFEAEFSKSSATILKENKTPSENKQDNQPVQANNKANSDVNIKPNEKATTDKIDKIVEKVEENTGVVVTQNHDMVVRDKSDIEAHFKDVKDQNLNSVISKLPDGLLKKGDPLIKVSGNKRDSLLSNQKSIRNIVTKFSATIKQLNIMKTINNSINALDGVIKSLKEAVNKHLDKDIIADKIVQYTNFLMQKGKNEKSDNADKVIERTSDLAKGTDIEIINKKLSEKLLDKKYMDYVNENKNRLKMLDELKAEINKNFNSSEEVKAAQMSPKLKEIRINDISAKIGLLALNRISD